VAGAKQIFEPAIKPRDLIPPILVRTGVEAPKVISSQAIYFMLQLSLLGFVYLSLKNKYIE
jgi:hypothetical protein